MSYVAVAAITCDSMLPSGSGYRGSGAGNGQKEGCVRLKCEHLGSVHRRLASDRAHQLSQADHARVPHLPAPTQFEQRAGERHAVGALMTSSLKEVPG